MVGFPLGWWCGCMRCGVATGVAAPPPAARQAILLQLQPPAANARIGTVTVAVNFCRAQYRIVSIFSLLVSG